MKDSILKLIRYFKKNDKEKVALILRGEIINAQLDLLEIIIEEIKRLRNEKGDRAIFILVNFMHQQSEVVHAESLKWKSDYINSGGDK